MAPDFPKNENICVKGNMATAKMTSTNISQCTRGFSTSADRLFPAWGSFSFFALVGVCKGFGRREGGGGGVSKIACVGGLSHRPSARAGRSPRRAPAQPSARGSGLCWMRTFFSCAEAPPAKFAVGLFGLKEVPRRPTPCAWGGVCVGGAGRVVRRSVIERVPRGETEKG